VQARLLPDPSFPELAPDVQRRLSELRGELEARMLELVRLTAPPSAEQLAERVRALEPVLLVNALSFGLDCPTLEKQSLLEAPTPDLQGELAAALPIIRIAEARLLPRDPRSSTESHRICARAQNSVKFQRAANTAPWRFAVRTAVQDRARPHAALLARTPTRIRQLRHRRGRPRE
jgi:hypothetical protein